MFNRNTTISTLNVLADKIKKSSTKINDYPSPDEPNDSNDSEKSDFKKNILNRIDKFNNREVLKALKAQLVENEIQKRQFKSTLMKYVKNMIIVQVILIAIPLLILTLSSFIKNYWFNPISENELKIFCNFMEYYISAIILEFLTMLFYIVKYVFDKSITDLLKTYKLDE